MKKENFLKEVGILIVDDDSDMLDLIEEMCKKADFGYIYRAQSGIEALKLLQRHSDKIDLVSLDFKMPGMDGLKVAEIVANTHDRIVGLVMFTGFDTQELEKIFYSKGTEIGIVEGFVSKPSAWNTVITVYTDAVRDVLSKREKQLEAGTAINLKQVKSALIENIGTLVEVRQEISKLVRKIDTIEYQINELKNANIVKGAGDVNYVWALTFLFLLVTGGLAWASFYLPILSVLALASVTIVVLMLIAVFDLSKGDKLSEKSLMEVLRRAFSFIGRKQK